MLYLRHQTGAPPLSQIQVRGPLSAVKNHEVTLPLPDPPGVRRQVALAASAGEQPCEMGLKEGWSYMRDCRSKRPSERVSRALCAVVMYWLKVICRSALREDQSGCHTRKFENAIKLPACGKTSPVCE
jgi:hypothetical protein